MNFEQTVINKVTPILQDGERAEFCYGSLFVECAEDTSKRVLTKLSTDYNGKVVVSKAKCSPEYVFDFVA